MNVGYIAHKTKLPQMCSQHLKNKNRYKRFYIYTVQPDRCKGKHRSSRELDIAHVSRQDYHQHFLLPRKYYSPAPKRFYHQRKYPIYEPATLNLDAIKEVKNRAEDRQSGGKRLQLYYSKECPFHGNEESSWHSYLADLAENCYNWEIPDEGTVIFLGYSFENNTDSKHYYNRIPGTVREAKTIEKWKPPCDISPPDSHQSQIDIDLKL